MKTKHLKLFVVLILSFFSCQNVQQTSAEYTKLLVENDSLKKILEPFVKEQQKAKANSNGLAYDGQISIDKIETGFDPYHNSSDLWLPCVAIKFKNISNRDINDYVKVTAIFIDNSNAEQIGTEFIFLATPDKLLLSGTTKQITLSSSIGWSAVQNQSVTAKIYVNNELIKTLNIEKREFDGMIR